MENEKVTTEPIEEGEDALDTTADIDETPYEEENADTEDDIELEYDDDGDITIADDEQDDEGEEAAEEEAPAEEAPAPTPAPVPDEAARLRAELATRDEKTRAMLKALGYDTDDVLTGIDSVAAEAEGKSLEEYRSARDAAAKTKAEEDAKFLAAFEQKKAADLLAVQTAIPAAKKYASVDEFPHADKFKAYVDKGLTPEEAFRATHPEDVIAGVATAVKARDSKDHLRSNVPKGAKDTSYTISRSEIERYREMFPGLSDKQIVLLHRRATKK